MEEAGKGVRGWKRKANEGIARQERMSSNAKGMREIASHFCFPVFFAYFSQLLFVMVERKNLQRIHRGGGGDGGT